MPESETPETLAKEVIAHLSTEIASNTNNMMVFRSKIGFGILVGPFLLLGSFIVAAKGQAIYFALNWLGIIAICLACFCFLGIGIICSKIEAQAWEQNGRWRTIIADLHHYPGHKIPESELTVKHSIYKGYVVGYGLLLVAALSTIYVITRIRVV